MSLPAETGVFCWYSIQTDNVERTAQFYMDLFGWDRSSFDIPGVGTFSTFGKGGMSFLDISTKMNAKAPNVWMSYLAVPDLQKATNRVTQTGGTVVMPHLPMPGIGHAALVQDPVGTYFMPFTPRQKLRKDFGARFNRGLYLLE